MLLHASSSDFAVSDGKSLLLTFRCVLLAASRSQWLPVAWEQAGQITFVTRQARKDILQPSPGLYLRRFAAAEQGVDNGCAYGRIMIAGEQEVLAAQGQRSDCVLDAIVINVVPSIQDIAAKTRKKRTCVDQSPAHPGLGCKRTCNRSR